MIQKLHFRHLQLPNEKLKHLSLKKTLFGVASKLVCDKIKAQAFNIISHHTRQILVYKESTHNRGLKIEFQNIR